MQRVEGITKEELHWQYAESWNTIGALLSHVISVENYGRIVFVRYHFAEDEVHHRGQISILRKLYKQLHPKKI